MLKKTAVVFGSSLLIAGSTLTAQAAEGAGGTPNLTVSYSVSPAQFDGSGCLQVPVTMTATKAGAAADDISGTVKLEARYSGSNSANTASEYIGYSQPAQTTVSSSYFSICSFEIEDGMTSMDVTGTVTSSVDFGPDTSAPLSPSQLTIIQNPTKMSKTKVTTKRGFISYRELRGTATAKTVTKGTIGAGGRITLEVKKRGGKNWVEVSTTSTDAFGKYDFSYLRLVETPKGSSYRVAITDCGWCAPTSTTGKFK